MNKIQQAFDSIHADPHLKDLTKRALAEERKRRTRKKVGLVLACTLLCTAFVLILGIGGYAWIETPVSYVSIDVNPSIELALNRLDRVVTASSYNTEGAEILDGLSLKGKKYTAAIQAIVGSSAMDAYLADDPELVFTVASDEAHQDRLEAEAADTSRQMGHSCHSARTDMATAAQAHDNGLSLGKYNAYLQLRQYNEAVTVEECREMSVAEILSLIRQYQQGEKAQETPPSPTPTPTPAQDPSAGADCMNDMDTPTDGGMHMQEQHGHHGGHH